jgi:N-acetyl-anhydromuramyl-L-alanine amidase AmpD
MDVEAYELFLNVCQEMKAETEEEKAQILAALARMGLINNVSRTGRSKEQIIKDFAKHYKVLHVKGEDSEQTE